MLIGSFSLSVSSGSVSLVLFPLVLFLIGSVSDWGALQAEEQQMFRQQYNYREIVLVWRSLLWLVVMIPKRHIEAQTEHSVEKVEDRMDVLNRTADE